MNTPLEVPYLERSASKSTLASKSTFKEEVIMIAGRMLDGVSDGGVISVI